jgi:hypothetical protein
MDERQLASIRLLSRRFLELQGLRIALAGGTIAVVLGSYLAVAAPTVPGAGVALLTACALMSPGQWWLHHYYARRADRNRLARSRTRWDFLHLRHPQRFPAHSHRTI